MSKPTPGPWRWTGSEVVTADGETLLLNGVMLPTGNHPKDSEATANAVAIAVTPTMLSLLERFDTLDTDPHATDAEWGQFRRDVHALFAQIRGDQP